jgi:hypothetical protein
MPQAIKEFNGRATSGNATIYTCPADTVAILMPTWNHIHFGYSGSDRFSLKWKGAATTSTEIGNLTFEYGGGGKSVGMACLSKYDVELALPQDSDVRVIFKAGEFNSTAATNNSPWFGSTNGGSRYQQGFVRGGVTTASSYSNDGTYNFYNQFKVGPMVMGPGDVLSYHLGASASVGFSYSFLIIEEAGS